MKSGLQKSEGIASLLVEIFSLSKSYARVGLGVSLGSGGSGFAKEAMEICDVCDVER